MPTDPLRILKRGYAPTRPDPRLAIDLKHRLAEELHMTDADTATHLPASLGELRLVHLRVPDADRAAAFFGRLFDWEAERVLYRGHVRHYTTNTSTTTVLLDDEGAPPTTICFAIDEPISVARRISALGGQVVEEEGDAYALCLDPQGAALLFYRSAHHPHDVPTASPAGEFAFAFLMEDAAPGRAFYTDLIGREVVPVHEGSIYHDVVPGVGLLHAPQPRQPVVAYFIVDDLEAMRARVRELGGNTGDVMGMGPQIGCECEDDQGTVFGVCQLIDA